MNYFLSRLARIGWVERLFRRRGIAFRKYNVAPRHGVRAVQRRLLLRLRLGLRGSLRDLDDDRLCLKSFSAVINRGGPDGEFAFRL